MNLKSNPSGDDPTWQEAWDLFEGICVLCQGRAGCIHEIVPRSRRPSDWWKIDNRVALCNYCHSQIHAGNPLDYVDLLIVKRDCLLQVLGKTI